MTSCSFCSGDLPKGSVVGPMQGKHPTATICIKCIDLAAHATGLYDLDNYQKEAARTMSENIREHRLGNFGLGIAGEAGEVADIVKKVLYHGHEMPTSKLKKELGDVLWYVAALCTTMGFDLSEVAEENIEKLRSRYPEGFSEEASRNREEDIDPT